jgi:hypothetical protein
MRHHRALVMRLLRRHAEHMNPAIRYVSCVTSERSLHRDIPFLVSTPVFMTVAV